MSSRAFQVFSFHPINLLYMRWTVWDAVKKGNEEETDKRRGAPSCIQKKKIIKKKIKNNNNKKNVQKLAIIINLFILPATVGLWRSLLYQILFSGLVLTLSGKASVRSIRRLPYLNFNSTSRDQNKVAMITGSSITALKSLQTCT